MDESNMNLAETMREITKQFSHKIADMEDSAVYAYIQGAMKMLERDGLDITNYAIIRVSTPMEYKDGGMAVNSQWRIVPVAELRNLPIYQD